MQGVSGAPAGPGAVYAWKGNSEVGSGRMEIKDAQPAPRLVVQLDFLEPMEGHNTAEFTLSPIAGGTHVHWAMFGPAPYLSKLIGIFVSMDRMIGGDSEAGLVNLKAAAEK